MVSKKVLVVDDSSTIRQQVSQTLRSAGFEVVEAVDGVDGLDKILEHADLAAVLCDVNMPRMNGIEMLEKVRAQADRAKLPILMLTTEGQPSFIQRAKQAGAKGWIIKPFRTDLLIATIRKLAA